MFLDTLRKKNYICDHPNSFFQVNIRKDGDRIITCAKCYRSMSLRVHFAHPLYETPADDLEEYVQWKHDYTVPCSLDTKPLWERAFTTQIITHYDTLAKGCQLLKILHAPFHCESSKSKCEQLPMPRQPTLDEETFFQNTIEAGLNQIHESLQGDTVQNALAFVRNIFRVESKRYFTVLAPTVIKAEALHSGSWHAYNPLRGYDSTISIIHQLLKESTSLHETFSKFCLAFDAVHVAALCCVCQDSLDLVSDLLLDFLAKACCGYYDLRFDPLAKVIDLLFEFCISSRMNRQMYRYLETLKAPQLDEHFSEKFFNTYWDLKSAVIEELVRQECPLLARFEWVFPRLLFNNHSDCWAFLAALTHYTREMKLSALSVTSVVAGIAGRPSPTLLSECKAIFRKVKMILVKMKSFHDSRMDAVELALKVENVIHDRELFASDSDEIENICWGSRDILKRFLEGNPELEKEWTSTWWVTPYNEEPDLKRVPMHRIYNEFNQENLDTFQSMAMFSFKSFWDSFEKSQDDDFLKEDDFQKKAEDVFVKEDDFQKRDEDAFLKKEEDGLLSIMIDDE